MKTRAMIDDHEGKGTGAFLPDDPTPHATAEQLAALRAGGLSAAEEGGVLMHVGRCTQCADFLLFLAGAPSAGGRRDAKVRDIEMERAWRTTRSRLESRRQARIATHWRRWAAAAAVAAVALPVWPLLRLAATRSDLAQARSDLAVLATPDTSTAIVDLLPGAVRGAGATGAEAPHTIVELKPEQRSFTLVIPVARGGEGSSGDRYTVRLLGGRGEELMPAREIAVDSQTAVGQIWIPRTFAADGDYVVEVSEQRDGEPPRTWTHPITVRSR